MFSSDSHLFHHQINDLTGGKKLTRKCFTSPFPLSFSSQHNYIKEGEYHLNIMKVPDICNTHYVVLALKYLSAITYLYLYFILTVKCRYSTSKLNLIDSEKYSWQKTWGETANNFWTIQLLLNNQDMKISFSNMNENFIYVIYNIFSFFWRSNQNHKNGAKT